ncbi:MBL fold metallo-hydrolase [Massilia sp. W12]|uniref:MBL fold metallo-hydrolase n=1 Tax=Massilia sp. W12 TaxID=3126507 RepID=UPI0030D07AC4
MQAGKGPPAGAHLRIRVLTENQAMYPGFIAEKGLSILLDDGVSKVLFDTGQGGALLENAAAFGEDLQDLTHIVLSHGHADHVGGLQRLAQSLHATPYPQRPLLVTHPDSIAEQAPDAPAQILPRSAVQAAFPCQFTRAPFWLHPRLLFLGEIPRAPHGPQAPQGMRHAAHHADAPLLDDSALAYCTPQGLVVLAGCAHSGICNILAYAMQVSGESRVLAVLGGFHLRNAGKAVLQRVAQYFNDLQITAVHACHCSGERAAKLLPQQSAIHAGSELVFALS